MLSLVITLVMKVNTKRAEMVRGANVIIIWITIMVHHLHYPLTRNISLHSINIINLRLDGNNVLPEHNVLCYIPVLLLQTACVYIYIFDVEQEPSTLNLKIFYSSRSMSSCCTLFLFLYLSTSHLCISATTSHYRLTVLWIYFHNNQHPLVFVLFSKRSIDSL